MRNGSSSGDGAATALSPEGILEMATKHAHAASIKNKLDLSIKKNEIYQLKAIIAQLKATMLRKDQEATALKETVAKIKEDYESVALDHATAAIALTRLTEEAAELNNIIASSSVEISQYKATVTNVIATYEDTIAILRLENKKKTEEAAALNNIITSSSVQISQFKLEVSTLAEERDLLTMSVLSRLVRQ
ncbi:hypothetical protein ACHAW5_007806 [Stephanodiscus triporus]|uniref:Uncharacterized protein n=1 Tax=Stephanodiscus triporus TaxID=2934178 RepID=A0ABD3MKS1_9STRA